MQAREVDPGGVGRWIVPGVVVPLLVTAAAAAAAAVWVSWQVPLEERPVVAGFATVVSVALCAAVAVAAQQRRAAGLARSRAEAYVAELGRTADLVVPEVARRMREGVPLDTVIAEARQDPGPRTRLAEAVAREIVTGERRRAAVVAACANAAGRVQAMATRMLADLRHMEERHSEEVLGDLLRLDHATAQAGRLADNIAVLSGARSGRRWTRPIGMESILRGAMSRIESYQRVKVHSACQAAIAGYAAEDVMHVLAELMDNATRFSAPSEEVHAYVEELHTGIVVTIEDAGLGMKPQALQRAEAMVSTDKPLDLATLSGTRLGLAVVGTLARKHKLHVFFRPSSRGGTGIVVRVPNELVVAPREQALPPEPAAPAAPALVPAGAVVDRAADGTGVALPKRPRGRTLEASRAADSPSGTTVVPSERPVPPAEAPAAATPLATSTSSLPAPARADVPRAPSRAPSPVPRSRSDLGARFQAFQQARARDDDADGAAGQSDRRPAAGTDTTGDAR